jgi:hypothetical protein
MVDTDLQTFGLPGQVPQWQIEFVNLIVRDHRRTGRKEMFISTGVLRLTGITEAEGQALLPFLQARLLPELHRELWLASGRLRPLGQPGTTPSTTWTAPGSTATVIGG